MPYPIIAKRNLGPASRKGLLWRRRRHKELLEAHAHEALVYRVDGCLVLDEKSWTGRHRQVIRATHVSKVDLTLNEPVEVDVSIPCRDAAYFTVRIVFLCTVTEPITVVRNGLDDIVAALGYYLRSREEIFDIAKNYALEDVCSARQEFNSAIKSIIADNLPKQCGVDIELSSVEMLTPDEIAGFEKRLRDARRWGRFGAEQASIEHSRLLGLQSDEYEQKLQLEKLHYRLDEQIQSSRQALDADQGKFVSAALNSVSGKIAGDPLMGLYLALASGGIEPAEFSDKLFRHVEAQRIRTAESDLQARKDNMELLARHIGILRDLVERGEADNVNVDPEKLDLFFNKLVEDASQALELLPYRDLKESTRFNGDSGLSSEGYQ